MSRLQVAVIVAAFVVLNVVGAVIYKLSRPRVDAPLVRAPEAPAVKIDVGAEKFRLHRSAGLAALETGDYDKAVEQFMQALRVGRADSDITELIKMAKDFQARAQAKVAAAAAVKPEIEQPPAAPAGPTRRRDPVRPRPSPKPVKVVERPRVEEPPLPLTLLVTSIPSGLVIEVDGSRKDMTPAKVQVSPGSHSVSFFKGENRLLQRSVNGEAGQVLTVDADLSSKLAPPEPAVERPTVAKVDPTPAPPPAPAPAPAPETVPAPVPTPVAKVVPETGELQIISLNVAGEVFVDDRSYGYTPVVAKNLRAGRVRVEVKVDGTVRRTRTADVVAGKRSTIKIP